MFAFDFQLFYSGFDYRFSLCSSLFFQLLWFFDSVLSFSTVFFLSDLEPTGDSFAC